MKPSIFQFLLLLICEVFFSCNHTEKLPSKEKYPIFYRATYDFDTVRIRVGLPPITDRLKLRSFTNTCITEYEAYCIDFVAKDTNIRPRLDFKFITADTVGACCERNVFIGPNYEKLNFYYGFKVYEDITSLGLICSFKGTNAKRIDISKEQADSILAAWAIRAL